MIGDMKSPNDLEKPEQLPDILSLRDDRDKQLALMFVKRGGGRNARPDIARETGLNERLVYRAIDKWLEWARSEWRSVGPEAKHLAPPADQAEPEVTEDSVTSEDSTASGLAS